MKQIYENYFVTQDGKVYNKHNKLLSPFDNGRGYLVLGLTIKGKIRTKAIHRLVAEAFIENPNNLPEVNHKDCNRLNNSVENLEWITHSENIKYSYTMGNRNVLGESNANCKTNQQIVIEICELLDKGFKPSKIRDLGYNYALVRKIKSKQNWSHISCNYNF